MVGIQTYMPKDGDRPHHPIRIDKNPFRNLNINTYNGMVKREYERRTRSKPDKYHKKIPVYWPLKKSLNREI